MLENNQNKRGSVRQRKKANDEDDEVEPLDEDDQARMVRQLQAESAAQQESINRVFQYLCGTAAVVLALSVFYLDQWHVSTLEHEVQPTVRSLSLAHGATSAVLHGLSPSFMRPKQSAGMRLAIVVDVLVAVATLWAARRTHDDTLLWMHYGVVASNAFVLGAALLLRWDTQSTDKAFTDLVHAQYRYKSL